MARDTFEFSFRVESGEEIDFLPGSYIWLILPGVPEDDPRGNRRAFSLSGYDTETKILKILFRTSLSGYKRTLEHMPENTEVQILGPAGSTFHWDVDFSVVKPQYLIAGGVGVAPYLHYVRRLPGLEQSVPNPLHLHFVNTKEDRAFMLDELQRLSAQKRFSFAHSLGIFQASELLSVLDHPVPLSECEFYISGTQPFVQRVYEELSTSGIPLHQMRFEQFYPVTNTKISQYFARLEDQDSASEAPIDPFRLLVDGTSSHLIVTDENGLIVFANQAAQDITGFSLSEMMGSTPRLWGGEMPAQFYQDLWQKIKVERKTVVHEIQNRRKNGQKYFALARITPLIEEDQVIGFIASEEDITERVQMEKAILLDKQKDEAMLNSIGEGLVAHDQSGNVILMNAAAQTMLGYSSDDLVGQKFVEVVRAEDERGNVVSAEERSLTKAFERLEPLVDDHVYVRKNGSKFVVQVTNSPILDGEKNYGVIQVFRDITHDREVDNMKTEFIALASHQLRTPLSTINWYIEMVLSGDAGEINEEQKRFLTEAYQGATRMVSLVNALLNVARIESGTFIVDPKPTDLIRIARSVMDELKLEIDQKNIRFSEEHDTFEEVNLDEELTKIIIDNIVTNAVKYTPAGGKVHMEIRRFSAGERLPSDGQAEEDGFLVSVRDTGVGIPEHQKAQIFDKLFRADNVRKTDTQGTGLGLYITKRVVEQSSGKIWFQSTENEGSVFYVYLPMTGMSRKEGSRRLE
ncbi:PAS domain S-box protein [Candidatus Woesebacteria bacterium]|nr:PAS domain S-box protein [Candidatus Woesebacteria bacterium]